MLQNVGVATRGKHMKEEKAKEGWLLSLGVWIGLVIGMTMVLVIVNSYKAVYLSGDFDTALAEAREFLKENPMKSELVVLRNELEGYTTINSFDGKFGFRQVKDGIELLIVGRGEISHQFKMYNVYDAKVIPSTQLKEYVGFVETSPLDKKYLYFTYKGEEYFMTKDLLVFEIN